jgi:hypothetical protein
MERIRAEISSYSAGVSNNNLTSLMNEQFIGIKSEYFSLNDKIGFSGGLRYTRTNSSIGKNNYWLNGNDYFYLLYREEGVTTEYLKIKEISQNTDYIGIPVEVRYFPFRPHLFRFYFKAGANLNYRLNTKTDVVFKDAAMEPYQNEVTALLQEPASFSSSIYGSAGVRIGRASKPALSFEICLPSLSLTSESTGLVNPIFGGGFQLNYQLPLKSNKQ